MAEDVRHIMMTDPSTESVYCHYQGDVVKFNGEHVANVCWQCPFWGGLAGGYGVECIYDDPNAQQQSVTYNKPNAAKAEAPEHPDDLDSVASQDGIAARDARIKLTPATDNESQETQEQENQESPEEQQQEQARGTEKPVAPKVPAQKNPATAQTAPVGTGSNASAPVPPKKGKVPPQFQKKAETVDVITEIVKMMK